MSLRGDQPLVVLFCGSRNWTDSEIIYTDVFGLPGGSIVVHGDANGADRIAGCAARHYAAERDLHVVEIPALWGAYGRSAGPRRNMAMLRACKIDFAFCYPRGESKGTKDMMVRLRAANIPHVIREHGLTLSLSEGSESQEGA